MNSDDILDRIALQCSILETRGTDEITLTTRLKRDLLLDELDTETLAVQLSAEFEIEIDNEEAFGWRVMGDVVSFIQRGLNDDGGESSYAISASKKEDDGLPRKRRGRPARSHKVHAL